MPCPSASSIYLSTLAPLHACSSGAVSAQAARRSRMRRRWSSRDSCADAGRWPGPRLRSDPRRGRSTRRRRSVPQDYSRAEVCTRTATDGGLAPPGSPSPPQGGAAEEHRARRPGPGSPASSGHSERPSRTLGAARTPSPRVAASVGGGRRAETSSSTTRGRIEPSLANRIRATVQLLLVDAASVARPRRGSASLAVVGGHDPQRPAGERQGLDPTVQALDLPDRRSACCSS